MPKLTIRSPLFAAVCASLVATAGLAIASATAQAQETTAPTSKGFTLSLKEGEVLQLIAPETQPEGREARQNYYRTVFPIAEALGYERQGQLNVREKVRSGYDPGAFLFFSWPSAASVQAFRDNPQFNAFKTLRREAWSELKIYDTQIAQDLDLTFDPAKHYTVLVAWLDDETRTDYTRYLEGIEPAVKRAGGRFIYKIYDPTMQTLGDESKAPGQITFVEWETTDGFARVQQSPEYRAHQQYFSSSVQKFEFYWLKTPD